MVVYERVPRKYGTVLTFGLSALWHGFYAGYYITFATGALFVAGARVVSYKTINKNNFTLHHLVVFKFGHLSPFHICRLGNCSAIAASPASTRAYFTIF